MEIFLNILIASVIGCIIGSFLNVVIHRLPKAILQELEPSLSCLLWPRSTAPCCGKLLHWHENIPLFSWLLLRGKCGYCKQLISPRYILVEFLTASAFAWSAWSYGLSISGGVHAFFFAIAFALFFIDLETFLLPDYLTFGMLWLGLLAAACGYTSIFPRDAILGVCLGFLFPWSINAVYFLIRKQAGFGGGDCKLLAALGAWVGWAKILPLLFSAIIIGLIVIGLVSVTRREKLLMSQALPFGPFLLLSGIGFILLGT